MTEKKTKTGFGKKVLIIGLEATALVLSIGVLGAAGLMWRLSQGPLDMGFARHYVEEALSDPANNYTVSIGDIVLTWQDLSHPFVLEMENIKLNRNGEDFVGVERASLGLSAPLLMLGQIVPVHLIVDRPSLHLVRDAEGDIDFEFASDPSSSAAEDDDAPTEIEAILKTLANPAGSDKSSPLRNLRRFQIRDARLVTEDHMLGTTWFFRRLNILFMRTDEGLALDASLALPGSTKDAPTIGLKALYKAEGFGFKSQLILRDLDARIIASKIPDLAFLKDHETKINGVLALDMDSSFMLTGGKGTLDLQMQGITFGAATDFKVEDEAHFKIPVTLSVPTMSFDDLARLWPVPKEESTLHKWLTQRLTVGRIENANATLEVQVDRLDKIWAIALINPQANFDIADMTVTYSPTLLPATGATGRGTFKDDTLDIDITGATVGEMTVTQGKVVIDKVSSSDVGTASIGLDLHGPLSSMFAYIARDPIGMTGEDLGLHTDKAKGDMDLHVDVSFPTSKDLRKEEVNVSAKGTLNNVYLPDVVKTLDLTDGPLTLTVGDGQVKLAGEGKLDARPLKLDWQQYLDSTGREYSSRIKAQIVADPELRTALGINIADWVEGSVPVDVTYTHYSDERSEASVTGDATNAKLKISQFAYEKPVGATASFSTTAILTNGVLQQLKDLTVKASDLNINKGQVNFDVVKGESVFKSASFPAFVQGETNADINLNMTGPNNLKITIKGPFLDARPFIGKNKKGKKEPYNGPAVIADINARRLRTQDSHLIENAVVSFDMNKTGIMDRLQVEGTADKGAISLRLLPDGKGKLFLRLEADNAGAALRAFDIYENVQGGRILLLAQSKSAQEKYVLAGSAQLSDFRVTGAPVLAKLISIISPTGIPELLNGQGLSFTRLEADFSWHMRPQGDLYVITSGRTSGNALGLTFAGGIDKQKDLTNLKGDVVPMSQINNLLGDVPVLGNILIGSQGGALFAATYKITGPTDNPKVSVNPLSVLAPGIIRRILFQN